MAFIGKDWRAPGEAWVRINHTGGWEQMKLRPIQLCCVNDILSSSPPSHATSSPIEIKRSSSSSNNNHHYNQENGKLQCSSENQGTECPSPVQFPRCSSLDDYEDQLSSSLDSSSSIDTPENGVTKNVHILDESDNDNADFENDDYVPHCKVKTGRSKEFIGCTSMSEAFLRMDLARAISDVRRFNYICKVVQILVNDKLQNISATARKQLFDIIQAIVLHSISKDVQISTARDLLNKFASGIGSGHVCGSPKIVCRQQDTVSALLETTRRSTTIPDSSEDSITFLDLPKEVISQILHRLPDHLSLLESAKAHETLNALIETETSQWKKLTRFHFTQAQIDKHRTDPNMSWRHLFFQLKKYHGLRELYADLIHICCHCKTLFWKNHGHPCVSKDAPSVRVTPQQFVDMLTCL